MRIETIADIDDDVRAEFFADGFLAVDRFVDPSAVGTLGDAYNEIIDRRVARRGDRLLGDRIRQVMVPSLDHPIFDTNPALEAGASLARRIFGRGGGDRLFDMLIDKPPGTVHETPWHQDAGYIGMPVSAPGTPTGYDDISVWVALDDVDVANGCMQFLPWTHGRPSLRHCVVSGDPTDQGRLIAIDEELDASGAVACPLPAGGCTVHLPGTPHYTGPNATDRQRRAYIFNLAVGG